MLKKISIAVLLTFNAHLMAAADDGDDEKAVCQKATNLLSAGKQADAEQLIFTQARKKPTVHIVFYAAVLVRSRFEIQAADKLFAQVGAADPEGVDGKASKLIAAMDAGKDTETNFKAMDDLVASNADNPLILWMSAVECRQLKKPKEGIERYNKLLKLFDPGPSLVHQTLGNLLLDNTRMPTSHGITGPS